MTKPEMKTVGKEERMKRKMFWILVLTAGLIVLWILYSLNQSGGKVGEKHISRGRFSKKTIQSDTITKFEYTRGMEYDFLAERTEEGTVHVKIITMEPYDLHADPAIDYESTDLSLLTNLEKVIREHELIRENGYTVVVDGLPPGYGERLKVEYDTGEELFTRSNESYLFSDEIADGFSKAFQDHARANGHPFEEHRNAEEEWEDDGEEEEFEP